MISNKRGFTLVELMVVIGMIAILMAAVGTSVGKTRERARIEKARSEVKTLSQAILAWENYTRGGKNELEAKNDEEADVNTLKFVLGKGEAATSGDIPVLFNAALAAGGKMLDPWGSPYRIRIKEGSIPSPGTMNLYTGYYLPNFYRLSPEERQ